MEKFLHLSKIWARKEPPAGQSLADSFSVYFCQQTTNRNAGLIGGGLLDVDITEDDEGHSYAYFCHSNLINSQYAVMYHMQCITSE